MPLVQIMNRNTFYTATELCAIIKRINKRNYEDCITDCNLALLKDPKHVKSLLRRGLAYEAVEKLENAYDDFRTVRMLDQSLVQANEGSVRIERALRLRKRTLDEEKNGTKPKATKPALTVAERVRKSQIYKDSGNRYFQQGRNAEAIREYTRGIELDDSNFALFSNRAAAYTKMGEYDRALDDAEAVIKLKADWPKGYYRKGLALYNMRMYVQASTVLQKCLNLDPSNQQVRELISECNSKLR